MSVANPGFHDGELAVQSRAGVTALAARLAGMLEPTELGGGIARFLTDRTFAALTARDAAGRLWISPVTGPPGFLDVGSVTELIVNARPMAPDPLADLPSDQAVGLVVIDFATHRRIRINGTVIAVRPEGLRIEVEQAYGNCPQFIQQRQLRPRPAAIGAPGPGRRGAGLTPSDVVLIRRADTFFIGTSHPSRGADASHRGGPPGFVRVEDGALWWPDYSGNNMFNSLGNLAVDASSALLFTDFVTGDTLHLSGRATLEWITPGETGDDDDTGRRVRFSPEVVASGHRLPMQASPAIAYPHNPPLTDGRSTVA
jgi:uncharacterized protein